MKYNYLILLMLMNGISTGFGQTSYPRPSDEEIVHAQHQGIGMLSEELQKYVHTDHPDAQWFGDAPLGFFIHWDIASVKGINIGWSMIDGLNGRPAQITPNEYWDLAKDFHPQHVDADSWIKAAKAAGFVYAVFTTRHHAGFAMWPSAYGNFSTKNYMGSRDLVQEYVDACRKYDMKIGLYYSPPDWYFDRDYFNFSRRKDGPELGPDLKPRIEFKTPEEKVKHQEEYVAMIKGQIEELLTNYGKIDLIWFDGRADVPNPQEIISQERIRELQPGIVLNPRLYGRGDYKTYERTLKTDKIQKTWAELCQTWTCCWPYVDGAEFRSNAFILGELAQCRALGINYLLGVGPTKDGIMIDEIYMNLKEVEFWMDINGAAINQAKPLPEGEKANVPATSSDLKRYLFAIPEFKENGKYERDMLPLKQVELILKGIEEPVSVILLKDHNPLSYTYAEKELTVKLPLSKRSNLVDVVEVLLNYSRQ